jgi:glycerol-3-phosphate dehydrogenase
MTEDVSPQGSFQGDYDVTVVGAGIIGAWIAREMSKFRVRIALLDKEPFPGFGVSKSGLSLMHAPDFCPSGTLKGRLCLNAPSRFKRLADELDVKFREVDELWLALEASQIPGFEEAKRRGEEFGAKGFEIIGPERIRKLEPNVTKKAVAALYVRGLGAVYPPEWAFALAENAVQNGARLYLNTSVLDIQREASDTYLIYTSRGLFRTQYIVNAAGLFADEIAAMVGDHDIRLTLTKGTMAILDKSVSHLIRHMVYGTFSGKHSQVVAPTAHGNLIVGLGYFTEPASKFDTRVDREKLQEVMNMGRELVPALSEKDIITSFAGIRSENNKMEKGDFYISPSEHAPGVIHAVIGSPGLTAAPAVADLVVGMLAAEGCQMEERPDFQGERRAWRQFRSCSWEEQSALIASDARFGRITCRCENVTESEIVEAIHRGAGTLDSVKHLTRAGMGRCQGGFCGPTVLQLLHKERNIPLDQVTKKGRGSFIVAGIPGAKAAFGQGVKGSAKV